MDQQNNSNKSYRLDMQTLCPNGVDEAVKKYVKTLADGLRFWISISIPFWFHGNIVGYTCKENSARLVKPIGDRQNT